MVAVTDREMLGSRVPSQLKEAVDRENRPNQDIVEAALRRYLATDEAAMLEMRLDHRQKERSMLAEERDDLNRQIKQLDEEIAALESQIEDVRNAEATYEESLDALLDEMVETGMHVDSGHGRIDDIVEAHDLTNPEVHADLKERAEERGLNLPDKRFEPMGGPR